MREIQSTISAFNQARNWEEQHKPKDVLLALTTEVGELAEQYHWVDDPDINDLHEDEKTRELIRDEIADVMIYLSDLANTVGIDLERAVRQKLVKNAQKYPVREEADTVNIKQLKFWQPLPSKILQGEKDTTWRVDDDKDLQAGDHLSLVTKQGEEFTTAEVVWTKHTTFGELGEEDKEGHESFESEEALYEQYNAYYDQEIEPSTPVKVVKFTLTD